jgi:hypothetical protein
MADDLIFFFTLHIAMAVSCGRRWFLRLRLRATSAASSGGGCSAVIWFRSGSKCL